MKPQGLRAMTDTDKLKQMLNHCISAPLASVVAYIGIAASATNNGNRRRLRTMTNYVCISCNNPVDKDGNRSNTAPLLSIEDPIPMYGTCCYPDPRDDDYDGDMTNEWSVPDGDGMEL